MIFFAYRSIYPFWRLRKVYCSVRNKDTFQVITESRMFGWPFLEARLRRRKAIMLETARILEKYSD